MACPKGMAWDTAKKKCVKVGPGESIQNPLSSIGIGKREYSLKGGINWFGEDSPSSKPKPKAKPLEKQKNGGLVATQWTRNTSDGSRRSK